MAGFSQVFSLYYQRHLKRRGHLVLAGLALIILVIDGMNPATLNPVRRVIDKIFQPLDNVIALGNQQVISVQDFTSRLFNQAEELAFLREENENLRLWRQYAQALEIENRQLNSHFQAIPPALEGEIKHFRISKRLPSAQRLELATEDFAELPDFAAVISRNALIGRLLSTEENTEKRKDIMLLSHPDSRVPVQVGQDGIQAMLAGQGHRIAKLEYHEQSLARIVQGDPVVSSRFLSYLPSGLVIGTVTHVDKDSIEVKLDYDLDLLRYIGVIVPKVDKS